MKYMPLITLLLILTQPGCQSGAQKVDEKQNSLKMGEKRSAVYTGLNFLKAIKRVSPRGLVCSGVNPAGGGIEYGGNPKSTVVWTDLSCEIKEANFNEATFMSRLKTELEKEIRQAGIEGLGQDEYQGYIWLEYRTANHHGWLEVIGRRAEGDRYKLRCLKRELGWD